MEQEPQPRDIDPSGLGELPEAPTYATGMASAEAAVDAAQQPAATGADLPGTGLPTAALEPPPAPPLGSLTPPGPVWATPAEPTPRAAAGPVQTVVIPLAMLVVAMLVSIGSAYRVSGGAMSAYVAGTLLGSGLGVLIVFGVALLITRKLVGRQSPGRYRLLAAAAALLLAIISGTAGVGGTLHGDADPATAMVIGAPYTLTAASSEVQQSFANAVQADKQRVAVEMVADGSGANVAMMVATTGGVQTPDFWTSFDRGFARTSNGGTTSPTTFHGQTARLFHASGVSGIAWVSDKGLIIAVYAGSDAAAMAVAEAQVSATAAK